MVATSALTHPCARLNVEKNGRDDWIRTSDLTHPKGALYQAEPRPDFATSTPE